MAAAVAVTALLLLSVALQAQVQAQPSLASGTFLYGITGGVNFEPPFNLVEYNPVLDYKKVRTGPTWDWPVHPFCLPRWRGVMR